MLLRRLNFKIIPLFLPSLPIAIERGKEKRTVIFRRKNFIPSQILFNPFSPNFTSLKNLQSFSVMNLQLIKISPCFKNLKPLVLLMLLLSNGALAQKNESKILFKDSLDQAFDVSDWLLNKKGFLVVPSVITEPAVGYGAAATAIYFHSSYTDKKAPPSMTGVFGMGTENGTWGFGVFHIGYWKKDHIRYMGALGKMNINVGFYGSANLGLLDIESVNLNMDSWLFLQQIRFRIGKSNFFSGGRYLYYNTNNTFDIPINIPEFSGISFPSTLSEASLMLNYDTRNNIFSPTKGFYLELSGTYSDTWMSGDDLYGRVATKIIGYLLSTTSRMVVGVRNENTFSVGNVPFYARPIVNLRGAPLMKYQNKNVTVTELEFNWNAYHRWNIVGFTGIGNSYDSFDNFSQGKTVASIGAGFRYLLARKFGMQMGMDFAQSTDDFAFYIVMGTSWLR